jgi:hypothetical protein
MMSAPCASATAASSGPVTLASSKVIVALHQGQVLYYLQDRCPGIGSRPTRAKLLMVPGQAIRRILRPLGVG